MIRALYEQIATPTQIGPLGLVEVLDWTAAALNRVDRASFFARFEAGQAVQYFYEPFLEAFDPELRKQLGVWYTPHEVVKYMVARVDTVLREELGIVDGLADQSVYVLDPCCGTGTYLVEVLKRIDATLRLRGADALHAHDLKRAAMERVFGFELLPAPFVVAHLQLGLLLQQLGAPLAGTRPEQQVFEGRQERVAVYLTNALTGWELPEDAKQHLIFPEMEAERDAADRVKQHAPVLVILGNPPYNGFAGVAVDEERELTRAYRTTTKAPRPQGQGLNDLYVRFYRMAERKIVEHTGRGIVCFISNYSWLDGLSFTGLRERFLDVFDCVWIDNLNGDKYRTGKVTPEGEPDPSIFSTELNREGIQVGTAIALLARNRDHHPTEAVHFQNLWGRDKRAELAAAADEPGSIRYTLVHPPLDLGLPLTPAKSSPGYTSWPLLTDLFPVFFPGVQTKRDDLLVDIDRDALVHRLGQYFDPSLPDTEIARLYPSAMARTNKAFDPHRTRQHLVKRGLLPEYVVRHYYRPFDLRWLYWEPEGDLLGRKSPDYFPQVFDGNVWFSATQRSRKAVDPPVIARRLGALHLVEWSASLFPLVLRPEVSTDLFSSAGATSSDRQVVPNLSNGAEDALAQIGVSDSQALFFHAIALQSSPAYRQENAAALRQNWPRIPVPADALALTASARLGREIATIMDPQVDVPMVSSGQLRAELQPLSVLARLGGGRLDPSSGELAITAHWGIAGKGGITMPSKGRAVERAYSPDERAAITDGAVAVGLDANEAVALLGETTFDVYLNDVAYWQNIPARVWEYTLGGYQVIKKWLSYREQSLLGRSLRPEEAREVTSMARRIAALVLLEPQLDANYIAVKSTTYDWPRRSADTAADGRASRTVKR